MVPVELSTGFLRAPRSTRPFIVSLLKKTKKSLAKILPASFLSA